MSRYFDHVVATDASAEQIAKAEGPPNLEFHVGRAESSGLADRSVDLVTAAQALHWLDTNSFFREAKRVLAPSGTIAVWGYGDPVLDTPELQRILHGFNHGTIEDYWLPERMLLLNGYATIPFPFAEVSVPVLALARNLTLAELIGYVRTWSATARYVAEHGSAGLEALESELGRHWGDPACSRRVEAPMYLRAGHMSG